MKNDGPQASLPPTDIASVVLALANTDSADRVELLKLAASLLEPERAAALLWLWDEKWHFVVLSRYAATAPTALVPAEMVGQVAYPLGNEADCPREPEQWALGLKHQPSISSWAHTHGFGQYEAILPVTIDGTPAVRTIAFLQLLSSSPIGPTARRDAQIVCGGMALLLTRSRDIRQRESIETLLRVDYKRTSIKQWLELAADKLMEITNAEAALMFREVPDGFEAVVTRGKSKPKSRPLASSQSVVTRVAEHRGPVRMRDFSDEAERLAAFGTLEHDHVLHDIMEADLLEGPVRSVLLSPVVFQNHTLAVIALVNKRADVHLARIFSKTDEDVLSNVCGFLKGVLPSIELYDALGEMAKVVSPKTLEGGEAAADVYRVLAEMIPAITGVALIRRPRGETAFAIEQFGGALSTTDTAVLLTALNIVRRIRGTRGCYLTTLTIPELPDHYLAVELKRHTMTGYEKQILAFFAKALSHILLADQGERQVKETFAQLRHAVRSGITGVVGYVNEALGCFELYRDAGYQPSFLSQARFRKALERANFAAKKSQHLLEESRFLLTNITRESLRVGNHSVSAVVRAVLNTLKPYAEERGIEVSMNPQLRGPSDLADFDRSLVEMLIFNVVDNAIKYSYRNRPLHITLDGTKDHWRLEVADYGTLIRHEDMEIIFRPFTRRPTGQGAEQRPGTGLGLAVARQIARAHAGDIACSSLATDDDLAETTFVITMPRTIRGR